MSRIIVTGATSMLGTALIKEYIEHGADVIAIARKGSGRLSAIPKNKRVTVVEADLNEFGRLSFPESDVLFHFGWAGTSREERNDPDVQCANISYTLDAAKLASKSGCKVFLGAGSQAEYGKVNGTITAEMRVQPLTCYGAAKFAAGKLSRRFCEERGIKHIWTRIFSVYGPHDGDGTMIKYALRCFASGETARFSAAVQPWNYLYEKDAGRIFRLLCEKAETGVYNVASDDTRPLKSFIEEIRNFYPDAKCRYADGILPDAIGLEPDISELLSSIGKIEFTPFADGIRETFAHMCK